MESFSKKVKDQLKAEESKKKCCKFTENAMCELEARKKEDIGEELSDIFSRCRCDSCRTVFLRRMFILFGGVTDPEKSYHLDFTFVHENSCTAAEEILLACGFDFRSYEIEKAKKYWECVINLPCSSNLTEEDVNRVVAAIKEHAPL